MTAPVGADIESLCTKCGDVWHVVVAKVGDKIAKVQCKQCGGLHRHRPPGGEPAALKTVRSGTSAPARARKSVAAVAEEPKVAADMSRPERRYSAADNFAAGDRIDHPTFGHGVVEGSPGAGKIQVFFPGGRRILAAAKAASSLVRPSPRDD
jgi:hypothetical protein